MEHECPIEQLFAHSSGRQDQQAVVLELWRLVATAREVWEVVNWVTANTNTAMDHDLCLR